MRDLARSGQSVWANASRHLLAPERACDRPLLLDRSCIIPTRRRLRERVARRSAISNAASVDSLAPDTFIPDFGG